MKRRDPGAGLAPEQNFVVRGALTAAAVPQFDCGVRLTTENRAFLSVAGHSDPPTKEKEARHTHTRGGGGGGGGAD